MRSRSKLVIAVAALALALCACAGGGDRTNAVSYDPQAVPSGPLGDAIRLGHDIIADTHAKLPKNVVADMSCEACHVNAGTKARAGSFVGTYARFPQWNKRAKRVITLQDRLAECFLYSMNGTPPAFQSKEMVAMVAYIAYLSRGVPTGQAQRPADGFIVPLPANPPNVAHGATIYHQTCETCHGTNGAGMHGAIPPLWGPTSFNSGAGMAHLDRMTGFVKFNMPENAPGTLSLEEAYDVASFVLSHQRPKFAKRRIVTLGSEQASYF